MFVKQIFCQLKKILQLKNIRRIFRFSCSFLKKVQERKLKLDLSMTSVSFYLKNWQRWHGISCWPFTNLYSMVPNFFWQHFIAFSPRLITLGIQFCEFRYTLWVFSNIFFLETFGKVCIKKIKAQNKFFLYTCVFYHISCIKTKWNPNNIQSRIDKTIAP